MKIFLSVITILTFCFLISCRVSQKQTQSDDYPILPVSFTDVELTDSFWTKRLETNRTVTIPFGLEKCESEGRIRNFERAAGLLDGEPGGGLGRDGRGAVIDDLNPELRVR